MHPKNQNK